MLKELLVDRNYLKGKSCVNEFGTELICETEKNDFLYVLYSPMTRLQEKCLQKELIVKRRTEKHILEEYLMFLKECNGCILFNGSIVLFGCSREVEKDEKFKNAPSFIRFTQLDSYTMGQKDFIYIGNAVYYDFSNVNFYFNCVTGEVILVSKGETIKKWGNFSRFLKAMISFYSPHYNNQGFNIDYDNRQKGVYHNIQALSKEVK